MDPQSPLMFFVFLTFLLTWIGGMQFAAYRMLRDWTDSAFDEVQRDIWRKRILQVMAGGTLLFLIRFLTPRLGLHDSSFIQALIINTGGLYFAIVFLLFIISVFYFLYRGSKYLYSLMKPSVSAPEANNPPERKSYDPGRREFIKKMGIVGLGAPVVLSTGLSAATHHNYQFNKHRLYVKDLPSGLEGLRIVQLSDIHSGIYMNKKQIQEIFELANSQDPHLTLLTGDMIDNHVSEIPNFRDAVNDLKAEYGVFGSPGNHDHYASIDAVMDSLADRKIKMLRNDSANLNINGERLSIIGVDDAGTGSLNFANLDESFRNSDPEAFRIMLSHRPHLFDDARSKSVALTLAGHTHGGQVAFNIAGFELYPIDLFHEYSRGLYTKNDRHLYVNTGVGLVGAPIRLVRPEIAVITLTGNPELAKSWSEDA